MKKHNSELLKLCSSGKEFINKFNFDFCNERYRKVESIRDALEFKSITLRDVSETYNRLTPEIMLQAWLTNMSKFMEFEITDQQARETSMYMFRELKSITLPLLTLLFQYIKMGRYGEFYGKFNGQKIIIACVKFRREIGQEHIKINKEKELKQINELYE